MNLGCATTWPATFLIYQVLMRRKCDGKKPTSNQSEREYNKKDLEGAHTHKIVVSLMLLIISPDLRVILLCVWIQITLCTTDHDIDKAYICLKVTIIETDDSSISYHISIREVLRLHPHHQPLLKV